MKNSIALLIVLFTTSLFSQITLVDEPKTEVVTKTSIGKISSTGKIYFICEKEKETITFTYLDLKSKATIKEYKTFSFEDINGTFDTFYKILNEGTKSKSKEVMVLKLGDSKLKLKFDTEYGAGIVNIYVNKKGVTGRPMFLNNTEVIRLFGKNTTVETKTQEK